MADWTVDDLVERKAQQMAARSVVSSEKLMAAVLADSLVAHLAEMKACPWAALTDLRWVE